MNKILLLMTFCYAFGDIQAQHDIIKEISLIQRSYQQASDLSFSIKYLYSRETKPEQYLDSVKGIYKYRQGESVALIDNIEYLYSKEYTITVFNEDKAILVDVPAANMFGGLSILDTLLKKVPEVEMKSEVKGHFSFQMPEYTGYKQIDFWYDPETFFLKRISYTAKLIAEDSDEPEEEEGWSIVQVIFTNYSTEKVQEDILLPENYIKKYNKEFVPSDKYPQYQVYVVSPKLLN